MLYERTESDGEVTIEVTPVYYWLRYATLTVFAVSLLLQEVSPDVDWWKPLGPLVFVLMIANVAGMWIPRREASRAMRDGALRVSGSAWNFNRPLRYSFRCPPPSAKSVS